ncbi:hypothetical protein LCGC14_0683770 [marine sediment metagenome]|uniref:DNA-directed DNA polymerase n=1 Tax=marine sediment metagenome TaxID=412755 RepID=A0A0F9T8W8_9ZZZZ
MTTFQFFGKIKPKSDIDVPWFGMFALIDDKWASICADLSTGKLVGFRFETVAELFEYITKYGTPPLWYSYDLREFFDILIRDVVSEEWLLERVPKKGGGTEDKVTLINTKNGDILKALFPTEKKRKISKRGKALTLLNAGNYYNDGFVALSEDFSPLPFKGNAAQLGKAFLALLDIHYFTREKLGVSLGVSFASTVMRAIQARYLDMVVPKLDKELEEFIEAAFYGGKAEVYRIYEEHAWVYDKDGLYNEADTHVLPVKGPYIKEEITPDQFMKLEDIGYIDVDVYVPETLHKGPLPFRGPNGISYPVGTLRSSKTYPARYFSPLLKQAVKMYGVEILKIHHGVFFKTSKPILREWAEYTATLKKNAKNKGEKWLAKLCQNVPYGKFAQKEERQITHIGTVPKERRRDLNISTLYNPSMPGDEEELPIWFETVKKRLPNHLPQIAAAITGWAHMIMQKDFARAEAYGLRIDYTDTDSIIANGELPPDMTDESQTIGHYKTEYKDVTAVCVAPKMYFILEKEKCILAKVKGFPNYQPNNEDVQDLLKGIRITTEWDSPPSVVETLITRLIYAKNPTMYENTLEARPLSHHNVRTFPGTHRATQGVLDFDTKRRQLSLTESRPLHIREVLNNR